jgi:hypothetical protein
MTGKGATAGSELTRLREAYFAAQHGYDPSNGA